MRRSRAELRWPPEGSMVDVDGARVHYRRGGSGPTLILIHGASGNLRDWTFSHFGRFAGSFDVVAFDRPGHGHSDRIPTGHDPHRQAAHLRRAARALGIDRAIVCGHSYGGTIALTWGVDDPASVSGLCLLAAPSHEWEGSPGPLYEVTDHWLTGPFVASLYPVIASERLVRTTLDRIFAPARAPEGYVDHVGPGLALRYRSVRWNAADIARLKPYLVEMTPRYRDLTVPVELIHGDADIIVPLDIHSRPLRDALPHARLTVLENTGHMPHHTDPGPLDAALSRLGARA